MGKIVIVTSILYTLCLHCFSQEFHNRGNDAGFISFIINTRGPTSESFSDGNFIPRSHSTVESFQQSQQTSTNSVFDQANTISATRNTQFPVPSSIFQQEEFKPSSSNPFLTGPPPTSESFFDNNRPNPTHQSSRLVTVNSLQLTQNNKNSHKKSMPESCLACICQASTSCNLATSCVSSGQYCGPFLISKPYWIDADRPILFGDSVERDGAFDDCAVDPICSAQAVRQYMNKFQKDCNGDGIIDCKDLARIHLMGPYGDQCTSPNVEFTGFYKKFNKCWGSVLQVSRAGSTQIN